MKLFLSLARNAGEIHLIFDNYFDDSFKTFERIRRSKAKGKKKVEALPVIILSGEQRLPASMDSFWPLSGNKLQLQRFTIDWISKTIQVINQFIWEELTKKIHQIVLLFKIILQSLFQSYNAIMRKLTTEYYTILNNEHLTKDRNDVHLRS